MGRAMVDLYCEFISPGTRAHNARYRRHVRRGSWRPAIALFNAHYDEYGFQPIVVFDGAGRFITAVLRPAKRPSGKEIVPSCAGCCAPSAPIGRETEILLRADSHYCCPEVLDFCRANGLDYILGVAPTTTLRRHIGDLEASMKARYEAAPKDGKARRLQRVLRRRRELEPRRAYHRPRRGRRGGARHALYRHQSGEAQCPRLYEDVIAGAARPKITSNPGRRIWRRTAPHARSATANQLRLFLHAGAYWIMWGLRVRCRKVRCGASRSSTRCACASSKSPRASSR